MTKIVTQIDDFGYYIGPSIAYESPLAPGIFHIPGGAIDTPPPEIPNGQRVRWQDGAWAFEDLSPDTDTSLEPSESLTEEQLLATLTANVRNRRNQLLKDSDWTQLSDVQESLDADKKTAWATYRQALRDITSQPGFPKDVTWPTTP